MSVQILQGHVLDRIVQLSDNSVDCIFFSPPYYWARKYDIPDQVWGGLADCNHNWKTRSFYHEGGAGNSGDRFIEAGELNAIMRKQTRWQTEDNCEICNAWRGQFGREQVATQYIQHFALLAIQLYRVLKPTGTIWINIAESYHKKAAQGIPERVAVMLIDSGFSLRSHIIWDKGGSQVPTDRPDNTTESVLFAVKARDREKYFYDKSAPYARDKIWKITGTGRRGHNAGCPVELPLRCIRIGCPPGGVVLDPFNGSGSAMQAALQHGCQGIGIELNQSYCEVAS